MDNYGQIFFDMANVHLSNCLFVTLQMILGHSCIPAPVDGLSPYSPIIYSVS